MEQTESIWDPVMVEDGTCFHWQIGPFKLWVERAKDEWNTAIDRVHDADAVIAAQVTSRSEGVKWIRWAATDDSGMWSLSPVMPDRAVLVRPDSPFNFPPGSDVMFFISIPIWIRAMAGHDSSPPLFEEPTVILSNSWFGTPASGSLCYSLRTTARRAIQSLRKRPHMAICPIRIRNEARSSLEFQRFCIHAPHLSLYRDNDRLWTSQVNISYQGESRMIRTEYLPDVSAVSRDAMLVSGAREPVRKHFIQRSFDDLRSFIRM